MSIELLNFWIPAMQAWIPPATLVHLLADCLRCQPSISSSTSSGPAGTITRLKFFSDKDFLYVSFAFFQAMTVAVSSDLHIDEESPFVGDGAPPSGTGVRHPVSLDGSHDEAIVWKMMTADSNAQE